MEFLWKHVFDLVERMWELNQNDIAKYLSVHRSTISKLKKGTQSQFNRPCNELYRNLFDPTNPKSPVYGKQTMELLRDLKDEINEVGLADLTKGLKDDNYEAFVIELLRLAKENQSKLSIKEHLITHNITENNGNNNNTNETIPEKMSDLFNQSFDGFAIEDFVNSNPVDSLTADRIHDAISFIGRILYSHENEENLDKNTDLYHRIIEFTNTLLDYIKFLKRSSESSDVFPECYKPRDVGDNDFIEEANRCCQELESLYQTIFIEIDREQKEFLVQQRSAHKEDWNKNTLIGSL